MEEFMKNLKRVIYMLFVSMMLFLLSSCNKNETITTSDTSSNLSWEERWKQEPFYGKTITYWIQDPCQSGPRVADLMGYFAEEGLTVEGLKGKSYTEPLGTNKCQVAVGHIATLMVPSTNGVDLSFVGGAHHGCKSLYALADSEFTEEIRKETVACMQMKLVGNHLRDHDLLLTGLATEGRDIAFHHIIM